MYVCLLFCCQKEVKDRERYERKISEVSSSRSYCLYCLLVSREPVSLEHVVSQEIHKMFETGSFYHCVGGDLTNSVQRLCEKRQSGSGDVTWRDACDEFFWNKHMLRELIELNVSCCN